MIHYTDVQPNGFVTMWDTGPEKPEPPERPVFKSKHKEGTPEHELDRADFEEDVRSYKSKLDVFRRLRSEWEHWQDHVGGPRKIELWPTVAREVLEAQADGRHPHHRYHKRLPNGVKPGKAQIADDKRAEVAAQVRQRELDTDPHFGKQQGATP